MRDQLREFGRGTQKALDHLPFGRAVNFKQRARRRVDDRGAALRVEGDEAGGHAGDDAFAELLGARRTRAGARAARVCGVSATSVSVNRFASSSKPTTNASANCTRFS